MLSVLTVTGLACGLLGSACRSDRAAEPGAVATRAPVSPSVSPAVIPSHSPFRVAAPPTSTQPAFHGSISPIDDPNRAAMVSWRPGCPVPIDDLRLLTLDHWGLDGKVHTGALIVHKDVATDVVAVVRQLFDARFPIRRMRLVDEYGADDDRSMAEDNTSAFNCRPVTGGSAWSAHSYGGAIDINPRENPYVTSEGAVLPPEGRPYADRSLRAKGMIHQGDVVVKAFASVGWAWGGTWSDPKDYQHFSSTGR